MYGNRPQIQVLIERIVLGWQREWVRTCGLESKSRPSGGLGLPISTSDIAARCLSRMSSIVQNVVLCAHGPQCKDMNMQMSELRSETFV